jgi:LemA protein
MKKWLGLGVVVVLGLWLMSSYNSLATIDQGVKRQSGQLQNVLQRQAELIPNLVETVKGYAGHESKTFIEVAEARSGQIKSLSKISPEDLAKNPDLQKQLLESQAALRGAMINLNAVREAYPQLKANESFNSLMAEMSGSINRVTNERRTLQLAIEGYNKEVVVFPRVIVAKLMGFGERPYFEADAGSQRMPTVKFGASQ